MSFEDLYKKVQDGTATEEERKIVEDKIKAISAIFDEPAANRVEFEPVANETIAAAQKAHSRRSVLRIVAVVAIMVIALGGLAGGFAFGKVEQAKHEVTIDEGQAIELAKTHLANEKFNGTLDGQNVIVEEVDRELDMSSGLRHPSYYFEVELECNGVEYKVHVNATDGFASIVSMH